MEPKNGSGDAPSETEAGPSTEQGPSTEAARPAEADAAQVTSGDDEEAPEPAERVREMPLPEVPEQVGELAGLCQRAVQRLLGVSLDFTPDTLSLLDHYVTMAAAEDRNKIEALDLVAKTVGAYFGEVVRRQFTCWWHAPGDDISAWHLRFEDVYLMLSPYAIACVALGLIEPDGVMEAGIVIEEEELEEIAAHLAQHPPIPEDEFVLPSTRFDVLHIVIDQLKARAHARNLGDVEFNDADYDSLAQGSALYTWPWPSRGAHGHASFVLGQSAERTSLGSAPRRR